MDTARYEAILRLEAAGQLPAPQQDALNRLRTQPDVLPALDPWQPDHPQIAAAEEKYKLPKGALSALATVESGGDPQAVSPTGVTGLFQITQRTGKPYGLTELNRTNPYLSTDVAARHLSDLLQQTGGNLDRAIQKYKGPDVSDPAHGQITHAEYLQRFKTAWAKYGGTPETAVAQAPAPAPTTAAAPPAPAPEATATEAPGFGRRVLQRAGFGQTADAPVDSGSGAYSFLGRLLENLNAGPMGPLLRMVELPAAAGAQGVEALTGSRTAGNVAQLGLDLVGPKVATAVGSRAAARVLPRTVARTLVPRAAARLDVRDARRAIPALEGQIDDLGRQAITRAQEAEAATQRAVTLKQQAQAVRGVPIPLPADVARQAAQVKPTADNLIRAGLAAAKDTRQGLKVWRSHREALFQQAEALAGDAHAVGTQGFRDLLTDAGYVNVTDDGLDVITTGLGLTAPRSKELLRASLDRPLTFKEARELQVAVGKTAFGPNLVGTFEQGFKQQLWKALNRGIDEFMSTVDGVSPALDEAKQAYITGKFLYNDTAKRLVLGARNKPLDASGLVARVFGPGKPVEDVYEFKQLVSDDVYKAATSAWWEQTLRKAGGPNATVQSFAKALDPYLMSGKLEAILPPAEAAAIRQQLTQALGAATGPGKAAKTLQAQSVAARGEAATAQAAKKTAETQRRTAEAQVKQFGRQSARAQQVLAKPTLTRRLVNSTGKKIGWGLGIGAAGAGAYYGSRASKTP